MQIIKQRILHYKELQNLKIVETFNAKEKFAKFVKKTTNARNVANLNLKIFLIKKNKNDDNIIKINDDNTTCRYTINNDKKMNQNYFDDKNNNEKKKNDEKRLLSYQIKYFNFDN